MKKEKSFNQIQCSTSKEGKKKEGKVLEKNFKIQLTLSEGEGWPLLSLSLEIVTIWVTKGTKSYDKLGRLHDFVVIDKRVCR